MKNYTLLFVFVSFLLSGCGDFFEIGEHRGEVRYEDCREKIIVESGDLSTSFKSFICQYNKTKSGVIMNGTCIHVDVNSEGHCQKAYIYNKKQEAACDKTHPVLHEDDLCYAY